MLAALGLVSRIAHAAMGRKENSQMPTKSDKNPHARSRFDLIALNGGNRTSPQKFTDERKIVFLRELADCGLRIRSAAVAGVSSQTVSTLRKADKTFASLCETAEGLFAEKLIEEAKRRAYDGWEEPVYQKGQRVHEDCEKCKGYGRAMEVHYATDPKTGVEVTHKAATGAMCEKCSGTGKGKAAVVRRYSERLMEQLLRAYDPRFRDKQETNVTITGGVLAVPMAPADAAEWHRQYSQPTIDVTEESRALTVKLTAPPKPDKSRKKEE